MAFKLINELLHCVEKFSSYSFKFIVDLWSDVFLSM